MKKVTKFFMAALLAGMCSFGYAQQYEWQKPVQPGEKQIDICFVQLFAGYYMETEDGKKVRDDRLYFTETEIYSKFMAALRRDYDTKYPPGFIVRDLKYNPSEQRTSIFAKAGYKYCLEKNYNVTATIVVGDVKTRLLDQDVDSLTRAIKKALQDIREGSRLALDQIKITNGNKEDFKDRIVEILLDEGYKVVAKEYLDKLYQEQQDQQSGIYNDRTTVQNNNFSAVGYYINVKQTETSIKVQVINVSTGEYEANTTVNF